MITARMKTHSLHGDEVRGPYPVAPIRAEGERRTVAEYSIPKSNLASLLERIDRLNKVADKLGQPRIVVTQGEPVWVPTGFEGPARMFIPIMVTGEAPKVAGWTFKAAIDHVFAEDGERMTIVRKPRDSGDADLPEQYRNPEPWCDHCHQTRLRKTTYIMQSDAGEWKQVGSNCLRDFLGHTDPEKLAEWFEHVASVLHEAEQDDDDWGRDGHAPMVIRLSDLMAVTNHVARAGGWVSRKNAAEWDKPSTSDRVMDVLFPGTSEKAIEYARENRPTDDDVAAAEKCIEWAKQLCEAERTSDYEYSLCTIAKVGYVEGWRHLGLAVSMWAAWNREMGIDLAIRLPFRCPVCSREPSVRSWSGPCRSDASSPSRPPGACRTSM